MLRGSSVYGVRRNKTASKSTRTNETGDQETPWLHRLRNEDGSALSERNYWVKAKLRVELDWIQKNVPARERGANLIAVNRDCRGTERAPSTSSGEAIPKLPLFQQRSLDAAPSQRAPRPGRLHQAPGA